MKRALITGVTGQDGSYLAELLLDKGYEVHGIIRRSSTFNTSRIDHLYKDPHEPDNNFHLHYGDITDGVGISNILREIEPHEIYNLAAQSHVKVSFEMPDFTAQVDAVGTIRLLEAIRASKIDTRFYQASTSELFGSTPPPQSEIHLLPRQVPMLQQNFILTGWFAITVRLMGCMRQMEFFLIMSHRGAARHSLLAKSQWLQPELSLACKTSST